MKYKLLALDIDGTLLNSKQELTPSTIAAIQLAIRNDIKVCLVSGRRPRSIVPYVKTLGLVHPLVACNGGVVADPLTLKPLQAVTIPRDDVLAILHELEKEHICTFAYRSSATPPDVYYSLDSTWKHTQNYIEYEQSLGNTLRLPTLSKHMTFDPMRIMVGDSEERTAQAQKIASPLLDLNRHKSFYSRDYSGTWYYEIYPIEATKSNGLRFLCEYFSIDQSEVVAVGDHFNDLDMIEFAGLGVAMGNAQPGVKEKADLVIGHHDEDGLALFIRERLL